MIPIKLAHKQKTKHLCTAHWLSGRHPIFNSPDPVFDDTVSTAFHLENHDLQPDVIRCLAGFWTS